MRDAEDDPLKDGIKKDAHQQEIHHDLEAGPHELTPKAPMKEHAVEKRRPSCLRVGQATPDPEGGRDQGLQDEPESTRAGGPSGNVLEECTREQVNPPSVEGVTQRPGQRQREHEQREARENGGGASTRHGPSVDGVLL